MSHVLLSSDTPSQPLCHTGFVAEAKCRGFVQPSGPRVSPPPRHPRTQSRARPRTLSWAVFVASAGLQQGTPHSSRRRRPSYTTRRLPRCPRVATPHPRSTRAGSSRLARSVKVFQLLQSTVRLPAAAPSLLTGPKHEPGELVGRAGKDDALRESTIASPMGVERFRMHQILVR